VKWSDDVMTAARTDTNVTANLTVTATFAINTYTLTYNAGAGGSVTGTTPQTVAHGASGTQVTATPGVGYHFVKWSDDVMTAARTDTNVTANLTVTATFAEDAPSSSLTVVSAVAASTTHVDVVFSNPLNPATVQAGDFLVNDLSISSAALRPDNVTVRLTGATQVPGKDYTVTGTLGSVADLVGNTLHAPNTADFAGHPGPWPEADAPTGVSVQFGLVFQDGSLSVTTPSTFRAPPSGYGIVAGTYFDITADDVFSPAEGFTVRIPYNPANVTGTPSQLRLYHWESGAWVNITTGVDSVNHTVSGHASSFSDFMIAESESGTPVVSTPASSGWSLVLLMVFGVAAAVGSTKRASKA